MSAEDAEGGFKIIDRRRRVDDEPPRPPEPVVEHRQDSPPEPSAADPPGESGRSLVGLFMMLGNSTLIALGAADDPGGVEAEPDLPAAADLIDVLLVLREKTEGRRSAEETRVLDELLYDLQLRYLEATRQSG